MGVLFCAPIVQMKLRSSLGADHGIMNQIQSSPGYGIGAVALDIDLLSPVVQQFDQLTQLLHLHGGLASCDHHLPSPDSACQIGKGYLEG